MAEIILNAEGAILGRLASYAAKQALLGNTIRIVNAEKALITGDAKSIIERVWKLSADIGQPFKGPFQPKMPDRFVRRVVRGMLPYKRARGREALERVLCYMGVPKQFAGKAKAPPKPASAQKLTTTKMVTVGKVCKAIGGKV